MLEPEKNPNSSLLVDPPGWMRRLNAILLGPEMDTRVIKKRRRKAEARRQREGAPHVVEYFHQLDDPYSHLTAQVLATIVERYNIVLQPHLIRPTGGANQPEFERLANWARRDSELVAPYLGLKFPSGAGDVPDVALQELAGRLLAAAPAGDFINVLAPVSEALWTGNRTRLERRQGQIASQADLNATLDAGSARLKELKHYSGATFYYGGEWYWGVDRLFHLEQRLRDLGVCRVPDRPFIAPRPEIDVSGVDASHLRLDFYPSLNSPYTSIIYDRTIAMKKACGVQFHQKPVLPMIMRGVAITMAKGRYIMFDTKREADFAGVPYGKMVTPIGEPTRQAYSLLAWAKAQGKDEALMSSLLRHPFAMGVGLHTRSGMARAVEAAGLDWNEAKDIIGNDDWKPVVERNQEEMVEGMGLWGVPSYRLSGPDGEPDLAVWGQDRLWLVAAEIKRRSSL